MRAAVAMIVGGWATGRGLSVAGRARRAIADAMDPRVDWRPGLILGSLAALGYLVVGPDKVGDGSHWPMALAFLDGRLYLVGDYPSLELAPRPEGGWYSPFPPLLSILLLPFAALGVAIWTDLIAALAGGISVTLMWLLLGRLDVAFRPRLALTIAWLAGSEVLWVAGEGGQHLAPQIVAAALLTASLVLARDQRFPLLGGLLLGAAAAARLPTGLALPVILWLYPRRSWPVVLLGLAVPAGLVAAYNLARFGSPFEFGYGLIESINGERVLDERWYPRGIVSPAYLPRGLYTMLLRGPEFQGAFPWVYPGWEGVSVLLTMPILWWISNARGSLALVTAVTAALVLLPDLLHGNPGFTQVGYRFIVDALPLLWVLLGLALRESMSRAALVAIAGGIAVNVWLVGVTWAGLNH